MRNIWIFSLLLVIFSSAFLQGWVIIPDHPDLAEKVAKTCVILPHPPQKRCERLTDIGLILALRFGAAEPDWKDGLSSPKHAFNTAYPKNHSWDPAIKKVMGGYNIDAGLALKAIDIETNQIMSLFSKLTCNSGTWDYMKLWKEFGRISHYCSDLAVPLHAYSVNIDGRYHEGDMNDQNEWYKGLWEYYDFIFPTGKVAHGFIEYKMGRKTNIFSLICPLAIAPEDVASKARQKMKNYSPLIVI